MKKKLVPFVLFLLFILKGYGQLEKTTGQVGVSVLPVYDIFKVFPNNKIAGIAVSGNLGYLTLKNLSIGIQPYYAQVSNFYNHTPSNANTEEKQNIKLYGLNTYLRIYFIKKEKFLIYAQTAGGFGNFEQKSSYVSSLITSKNSHTNTSIFTFMFGVGANYFVAKNFAIELNVPYIYVNQISVNPNDNDFQTAAPTIGFQYYWK